MTDRELLQECKQFLEDMHTNDPALTVRESQKLHAKVSAALRDANWPTCAKLGCLGPAARDRLFCLAHRDE